MPYIISFFVKLLLMIINMDQVKTQFRFAEKLHQEYVSHARGTERYHNGTFQLNTSLLAYIMSSFLYPVYLVLKFAVYIFAVENTFFHFMKVKTNVNLFTYIILLTK